MGQVRQHVGETPPHILLDQARRTEGCKQTKVVDTPARHRYAHPAVETPAPCWYVCHVIDMPILPSIIEMPSRHQYTCPPSIGLSSIHPPTIPRRHTHPAVDTPAPCRISICPPLCQYTHPSVVVVVHSAGDDVAGGRKCPHPSTRGGAKREFAWWVTQPAGVEWVGDAVAVVVEVAMVVSICVACPEVGIRHGLDKVAVGTCGWGWWWEREEVMWQFPMGSSHRWLESL